MRTQVLLEPQHEEALRREAKARKCSVSATLRQLLDTAPGLNPPSGEDPFADLAGCVELEETPSGRDVADFLYGRNS